MPKYAWIPQEGPQLHTIMAKPIKTLFFGGARGGGKSSYLIGDFLQDVPIHGKNWHGILFRRTFPELEQIIKESKRVYPQTGAEYGEGKKTWTWPNGATLKFRHLDRTADASLYQGHEYTWIAWDELSNWSNLEPFFMLMACLRSPVKGLPLRIRATGNPGGPGHNAVKNYFIDPAPTGYAEIADEETGDIRMFIPSRVTYNKYLGEDYIKSLKQVGSESLVRAWLEGDWAAVLGAYFDTFDMSRHVIDPLVLPQHWLKFRSFDWGSASPFSVGWWTISGGEPVKTLKGKGS